MQRIQYLNLKLQLSKVKLSQRILNPNRGIPCQVNPIFDSIVSKSLEILLVISILESNAGFELTVIFCLTDFNELASFM